jgi:hypothetical protein
VRLGTAHTYINQAVDGTLGPDTIHQTSAGEVNLGRNQAMELGGLFVAPPTVTGVSVNDGQSNDRW